MDLASAFLGSLITVAVLFFVFLITRQINLWYWKIDERIKQAEKQTELNILVVEEMKRQTEQMRLLTAAALVGKKVGLLHKQTGAFKAVDLKDLQEVKLYEYEITIQ